MLRLVAFGLRFSCVWLPVGCVFVVVGVCFSLRLACVFVHCRESWNDGMLHRTLPIDIIDAIEESPAELIRFQIGFDSSFETLFGLT